MTGALRYGPRMLSLLSDELAEYVDRHAAPEPELLARLREETQASLALPQMQVGRVEGALLMLLAKLTRARTVVEVGTYSGYSALSIAAGLPDDGRLYTCDIDPVATAVAQRYFDQSPHGSKITLCLGPAVDTIATLAKKGTTVDMAFIDADKPAYVDYYEGLLPMMGSGGLIVADNTLWGGAVVDPKEDSDRGIVRFNAHVAADDRVEQVLLSVRDGVMLARKR